MSPKRHAAAPLDWESEAAWRARLARDARRAVANQTPAQRRITDVLLARAQDLGAEAFALTGSTARSQRTAISDLDYHVIGPRPSRAGLADEVDVVATDAVRFWEKLRAGDDYVQWTLRCGCILFDRSGIFRDGLRILATERLWPDPSRKRARLPSHRRLHAIGRVRLASALRTTIDDAPSLSRLAAQLEALDDAEPATIDVARFSPSRA